MKNQLPYPTWVEAGFSFASFLFYEKRKEELVFFWFFSFDTKEKNEGFSLVLSFSLKKKELTP